MKAFFLDRDGVINKDFGYVTTPERVEICDGVEGLLDFLKKRDFKLIVIYNQSAVARGKASVEEIESTNEYINQKLGGAIDAFYYCTYHNQGEVKEHTRESFFRKPHPGMILQAKKDHELELKECFFLGDKFSDIEAASRLNIPAIQILRAKSTMHPGAMKYVMSIREAKDVMIQSLASSQARP